MATLHFICIRLLITGGGWWRAWVLQAPRLKFQLRHWWLRGPCDSHSLRLCLWTSLQVILELWWEVGEIWCMWGGQHLAWHVVDDKLLLSLWNMGPWGEGLSALVLSSETSQSGWNRTMCTGRVPQYPEVPALPPIGPPDSAPRAQHYITVPKAPRHQSLGLFISIVSWGTSTLTPLSHPQPYHPEPYPTYPDSHSNLPFAHRDKISGNFWGAQFPSLTPFFPLADSFLKSHISLPRWKVFRAAFQGMVNWAATQSNGQNQKARLNPTLPFISWSILSWSLNSFEPFALSVKE